MVGVSTFARWFGWNPDRPAPDPDDAADFGTGFGMELSFGPPDVERPASRDDGHDDPAWRRHQQDR